MAVGWVRVTTHSIAAVLHSYMDIFGREPNIRQVNWHF